MQDLQSYITEADLSKDLALIATLCGVDVAKALLAECRGLNIYIPTGLPKSVMVRYARDAAAEGVGVKQIARTLRISERYVQSLLQSMEPETEPVQIPLIDD